MYRPNLLRQFDHIDWLFIGALVFAIVCAFCGSGTRYAYSQTVPHPMMPDPKLTPGATDPRVTQGTIHQTVCVDGYTKTVRNVTASEKREVMRRYGLPISELSHVETDHFLSLENGGSNAIENLWPQYYAVGNQVASGVYFGAREKDVIEGFLHRQLCAGKITLAEDQEMLRDWVSIYKKLKGIAK